MSCCYSGMWQFYQAANIVERPILSIYPTGYLTPQFRRDMNRKVHQIRMHQHELHPLCLMWIPMQIGHCINHLVPVVQL